MFAPLRWRAPRPHDTGKSACVTFARLCACGLARELRRNVFSHERLDGRRGRVLRGTRLDRRHVPGIQDSAISRMRSTMLEDIPICVMAGLICAAGNCIYPNPGLPIALPITDATSR